jgi:putative tricarboxylic transport membrane protein
MYGGAISSIMLGIPGASTAVATTFDGRPLAKQGMADKALIGAAVASFIGGTISVVLFTFFAPPLAHVALVFGAPEEFALMMLAGGDDIFKTLFSIAIGLVLSAIGFDIISGEPRLVLWDITGFLHGVNFLVLAIGIYGIGEMLWTVEEHALGGGKSMLSDATVTVKRTMNALRELVSTWKTSVMGSLLGYFVGILPAAGATPGSLMAYGIAKQISKEPEKFGNGAIEGVCAPEAANNAASTGSMLPMLTLGIPGSPTTAILLGGMVIWGLEPGPRLFTDHSEFVWGLIASLYAANLFTVLINIAFIPVFIKVLKTPFTILAPIIFTLCLIGGYAPTQDMHDVWLMIVFGVVGPAVLAIVLGPLAEPALRQSLIISEGSFMIFFERVYAGPIMIIALILLFLPLFKKGWDRMRKPQAPAEQ